MINVSIVGGTGYTAGELLRILLNHPNVHIESVISSTSAGMPIAEMHRDLMERPSWCLPTGLIIPT